VSWPLALGVAWAAMPPDADRQLAREIYKEMIEIRSGYTTGSTTPVAEAVAARLRAAGFPSPTFSSAAPVRRRRTWWCAITKLRRRLKPILLLAHTDVVEANREDWSTDPFQFIEKDGYFYGRGTSDDKAQAAVWIANLIRYKREGFKPERDIIVALTADEEGGGPLQRRHLAAQEQARVDRRRSLSERGRRGRDGGRQEDREQHSGERKILRRFQVRSPQQGRPQLRAVPDNAIYHLATALERLSRYSFPLKTDEVTRAYFREMAKVEDGSLKTI
jgi:acetylornithine deacetylase/succinyl-diaminopimelate desuccinylase-like protein